jgi:hypothetical protein
MRFYFMSLRGSAQTPLVQPKLEKFYYEVGDKKIDIMFFGKAPDSKNPDQFFEFARTLLTENLWNGHPIHIKGVASNQVALARLEVAEDILLSLARVDHPDAAFGVELVRRDKQSVIDEQKFIREKISLEEQIKNIKIKQSQLAEDLSFIESSNNAILEELDLTYRYHFSPGSLLEKDSKSTDAKSTPDLKRVAAEIPNMRKKILKELNSLSGKYGTKLSENFQALQFISSRLCISIEDVYKKLPQMVLDITYYINRTDPASRALVADERYSHYIVAYRYHVALQSYTLKSYKAEERRKKINDIKGFNLNALVQRLEYVESQIKESIWVRSQLAQAGDHLVKLTKNLTELQVQRDASIKRDQDERAALLKRVAEKEKVIIERERMPATIKKDSLVLSSVEKWVRGLSVFKEKNTVVKLKDGVLKERKRNGLA